MPVLGVCRNAHGFASFEFLGFLTFDLVVASTTHCDEHLGSAVMYVPVVAASWLEGDVVDGKFRSVGRKLFNHMLDVFRDAGMNEYFLFTDTTCDYGFYDYRGLTRKAERTIRRDSFTQGGLEDGSLSFFLYEGRC